MIRPSDDLPAVPGPDGTAPERDEVAVPSKYTIRLTDFEGPLDLLLYLIQRDEIDIYDIPIAHITHQYLGYLDVLDALGLDNAGEFLVMAATLMRIKARMLLPVQRPEEDDDEIDPRDELVRRLLEYKKYKEAAGKLADAEEQRREWYRRGTDFPFLGEDEEPPEFALSMFDLLKAVRNVLDHLQGDHQHHVYQEVWTVEGQVERILDLVGDSERLRFEDVFTEAKSKMQVVVTFVAMLELLKQQEITVYQLGAYDDIWLSHRAPEHRDVPEEEEAADAS